MAFSRTTLYPQITCSDIGARHSRTQTRSLKPATSHLYMMMLPSTCLGWPLFRLHTLSTPLVVTLPVPTLPGYLLPSLPCAGLASAQFFPLFSSSTYLHCTFLLVLHRAILAHDIVALLSDEPACFFFFPFFFFLSFTRRRMFPQLAQLLPCRSLSSTPPSHTPPPPTPCKTTTTTLAASFPAVNGTLTN